MSSCLVPQTFFQRIFVFVNGKKLVDDGGVGGLFRDIYLDDYVELCNLEDGKEAVSHCVIAP